jgi:hypothetical protein
MEIQFGQSYVVYVRNLNYRYPGARLGSSGSDEVSWINGGHMRWVFNVLGAILVLIGGVWILQGANILMGSVMTGKPQYAALGVVAALVGIGLLVWANRRPRITRGGGG